MEKPNIESPRKICVYYVNGEKWNHQKESYLPHIKETARQFPEKKIVSFMETKFFCNCSILWTVIYLENGSKDVGKIQFKRHGRKDKYCREYPNNWRKEEEVIRFIERKDFYDQIEVPR